MSAEELQPNELADLYDAFYTVLESLPDDTHSTWQVAIESIIFGGEALGPDASNYGEQQAERNGFTMGEYRDQYGDGNRVTEFPTLTTSKPRPKDREFVDDERRVPVAPESGEIVPLFVTEDGLAEAISLLEEFPAEPAAESPGHGANVLLDTSGLPGVPSTARKRQQSAETEDADGRDGGAGGDDLNPDPDLEPNELADIYDGLYLLYTCLPDDVHPVWEAAVETTIFGGDALSPDGTPYGEQQGERNEFGMPEYRATYGDGDRVTEFPTLTTRPPSDRDRHLVDEDVRLPVAPESGTVLPLDPGDDELVEALSLLEEFPAEPRADSPGEGVTRVLDIEDLLDEGSSGPTAAHPTETSAAEKSPPGETVEPEETTDGSPTSTRKDEGKPTDHVWNEGAQTGPTSRSRTASPPSGRTETNTDARTSTASDAAPDTTNEQPPASQTAPDAVDESPDEQQDELEESERSKVLRQEEPGEESVSRTNAAETAPDPDQTTETPDSSRKYDDHRAERAHRRAQQRDPSDVVELGETIRLVLKEVDHHSDPPTVMGTKNRLVVFVTDVPRHVSPYDTIRAKVVDYGGKGNSAEAVFVDYDD